jgi:hypothetical protein
VASNVPVSGEEGRAGADSCAAVAHKKLQCKLAPDPALNLPSEYCTPEMQAKRHGTFGCNWYRFFQGLYV